MSVTRKQVIGGIVDVLLMIIIAAVAAFVVLKAVGLAGVNRQMTAIQNQLNQIQQPSGPASNQLNQHSGMDGHMHLLVNNGAQGSCFYQAHVDQRPGTLAADLLTTMARTSLPSATTPQALTGSPSNGGNYQGPDGEIRAILERGGGGSIFYQVEVSTRKSPYQAVAGPLGWSWVGVTNDAHAEAMSNMFGGYVSLQPAHHVDSATSPSTPTSH